jgi:hypothetical protein
MAGAGRHAINAGRQDSLINSSQIPDPHLSAAQAFHLYLGPALTLGEQTICKSKYFAYLPAVIGEERPVASAQLRQWWGGSTMSMHDTGDK